MRAASLAAAILIGAAVSGVSEARAQGGVVPTRRPAPDTTKRTAADSVKRDSLAVAPPDSAERALLARKGFIATRYQGDSVKFNADSGVLSLFGRPAIVVKDKMRAVGTTITYDQNKQLINVAGNPAMVRDPSRPDDIIAFEPIKYQLAEHHGTAGKIRTKATEGSVWYISAEKGGFVSDSGGSTMYCQNATMTTDGDSVPQYYFKVGECKQYARNYMVARPAILHVGEVPVFWIPWLYQDLRKGRRNGILNPRFGVAEIVRNSPDYRRTVDNVGVYIAPNDYTDLELAMDWRSGARPTTGDPGFVTLRGLAQYAWRDWFLTGNIGLSRQAFDNGQSNTRVSWNHQEQFSKRSSLNASFSYATSTTLSRQAELNPVAAVSTIQSRANYQKDVGPARLSLGGTQTQYLGREQLDRGFPSLSVTSKPISLNSWLTWTPSLNLNTQQSFHLDSPSEFAFHYVPRPDGALDSARTDRNTRTTSLSIGTPIRAGNFTISANLNLNDRLNDFPEAKLVIDPADTSRHRMVVYRRTFLTTLDWSAGVNLPQWFQGTYNVTPSITLQNVDPGGYWVRSERTGPNFVSQSKRLVYGLGTSPTYFGVMQHGFGPFAAFRHSITPTFTYSYSPAASVSDEYLGALGRTRAGYLGAIAQNRVSLSLSQVFEAKYRVRGDTSAATPGQAQARKIRLLSLQFSSVDYDFERARVTKRSGFATDRFHASMRSDLLPGFDVGLDYSLFDAPSISDSARFKPYLEQVSATLNLGQGGASLGFLKGLFTWATGEAPPPPRDTSLVAGVPGPAATVGTPQGGGTSGGPANMLGRSRSSMPAIQTGPGWQASLTFSANHPRVPRGNNVVTLDPRASCEPYRLLNPVQYDICLSQQSPLSTDLSQTLTTGGGLVYRVPGQMSVNGNTRFNLTPNWAAQWTSSYDLERGEFASQMLSLQRDIHDWQAIFSFSQASNGNFAFHFQISLKPAPDIKVPFDRQSYRAGTGGAIR